ncbi:MAG: ACT domain-containing protein [Acidobacteria bacterium]|nr:ACT domain-containing protein [Acidobacteriota bacterium]
MAQLEYDLAVTLAEDRPGMLALAIGAISGAGINIDGYTEMNGVVHILTTDLPAARRVLGQAGFRIVQEQQVVLVSVEDEPGAAAKVFQRIAEAHVNVKYSYLATRNRLVISSDNPQALVIALSR